MKTKREVENPATGKLEISDEVQAAIDTMARELYRIKDANKAKATALGKFETTVRTNEAAFLAGIPFAFEIATEDDGVRKIRGKLMLKMARSWDIADVVVEVAK